MNIPSRDFICRLATDMAYVVHAFFHPFLFFCNRKFMQIGITLNAVLNYFSQHFYAKMTRKLAKVINKYGNGEVR